jgi:enoyl-CoA hydratase/carnithine racemase
MVFETLNVRNEGVVLFVEISAPPMNLNGPELVRDLVSLIQQAEADEAVQVLVFKSADPDFFISHVDITRIKENRAEAEKLNGDPSIVSSCRPCRGQRAGQRANASDCRGHPARFGSLPGGHAHG